MKEERKDLKKGVINNINTSAFTKGDKLFLDPDGCLTTKKPFNSKEDE